jgi:hypothetical protein
VLHLGTELKSKPEPNVKCLSFSTNQRMVSAFPGCPIGEPLSFGMFRIDERQQPSEPSQWQWLVHVTFHYSATGQCRRYGRANCEFLCGSDGYGPVQLPVAKERNRGNWRDFF